VHWMLYRVNYESELGCQFSAEFLANHLPKFSASWVYCTVLMPSPSQFFFPLHNFLAGPDLSPCATSSK
jgi:hypothetical protein